MTTTNWRKAWKHKTQSPLEDIFLSEMEAFGFEPMVQFPLDVFYLDFAFPEIKLAVEIDGIKYHSPDKDAYKGRRIKELGWKLERFAGWFIWRWPKVAVSKILLQYFPDKLNEGQRKRIMGEIITFFAAQKTKKDPDFANRLIFEELNQ